MFEQAERDHLQSHQKMGSWKEVALNTISNGTQILDCMWIYVYKYTKRGRLVKCKARLVVRGDQERRNTQDTYAATLAGRSFRSLMAIAARFDLELIQYDAVNAFVNANLDDGIYMPLYGLRKSPLLWHRELTNTLKKIGFKTVPHEPCCLTLDGIFVFFYVDDIVFAFRKEDGLRAKALTDQLRSKYELTGGNDLQWFLGIEIIRNRDRRLIWLSQASYIEKIGRLANKRRIFNTPMGTEELLPFEGIATNGEVNSYQAYAMKLFGGLIGWRESIYMSRLIDELGVKLDASHIRIQCDNNQTIRLVNAEIAALKTKLRHVNIHNHWLRQEVANGTIEVTYTPSAELMADGLTKALQGPHFEAFVKQMGLEDVTSLLAGRSLPKQMTKNSKNRYMRCGTRKIRNDQRRNHEEGAMSRERIYRHDTRPGRDDVPARKNNSHTQWLWTI
ncbi:reverse transcriptase (RNA-dependent DNA polymerase) [Hirsutella rhossiliensis]|uniref:Reverse transcriptase (RNA-dependent DNA polymerase) domain-containing protein n=1 Tax=Hirsutella rhossiliensis TaxID=111463 RepID=A0A9P8SN95_9HYPO|nr:reverse transcriptase (RNA-dependent DNA polymerase) domain-containing protein [Hirsutella rhossiliensis]KAH0968149.1 reverse transcriptase (RNA-dependent DNA polymerase) domain-containing protein [Hirsutella rhossiliensis]